MRKTSSMGIPQILAPAGNQESFLAAIAAGADAIYCGLKSFSARMEAKNFHPAELKPLIHLAHQKEVEVYLTLNSLIKVEEIVKVRSLLSSLKGDRQPDALIVQDLATISIAGDVGYTGEIHLSTLANITFPKALDCLAAFSNVRRIVLPRELSIDEIKVLADACPSNIDLEVFIHGALCYAVSGRCYWSSYMGGKSGLRGRCVQPCRRVYQQGSERQRSFSCQDLSLDTLVKVLKEVPKVTTWKIEGRKKSPHYVYYTVQAYRLLRDEFADPAAKKAALALLEMALGRKGTHYNFLPQRPRNPLERGRDTGSGFQLGTVKGSVHRLFMTPRINLLNGDVIRIGYEDQPWHKVIHVKKSIPRNGQFFLNLGRGKTPSKGTPVFLVDRKEPALSDYIAALAAEFEPVSEQNERPTKKIAAAMPSEAARRSGNAISYSVFRFFPDRPSRGFSGFWLNRDNLSNIHPRNASNLSAWLPPVIWPDNESEVSSQIKASLKLGIRSFVLNAPWQVALFDKGKRLTFWAGPFCNTANPTAIDMLKGMGFSGAFVSPELGKEDVLHMPQISPLPLGIVVAGNWPLGVSRIAPESIQPGVPFESPKGELAWLRHYDDNFWVYPNWAIDLSRESEALQKAGYQMLVTLTEPVPKQVAMKDRQGLWNWKHDLM